MQTTESHQQQETKPRQDIFQNVTDIIIRQLEAGTVPWQRPWRGDDRLPGLPFNFTTGNHYRGINIVLLWSTAVDRKFDSAEWASFRQWQEKKEYIRKGEKGSMIVYADVFEKEVDGEIKKIPFLKSSVVFNRCQLASYKPEHKPISYDEIDLVEKIDAIDAFVENTKATIQYNASAPFYRPSSDTIYMPNKQDFIATDTCTATEAFYSTLLHELTHWTGVEKRLDRKTGKKFGDQFYATEELVAEIGAAFLCARFNISTAEKGDHANYIAHWLKVLKENKYFLVSAASDASKAVDLLQQLQPS